MMTYSSLLKKSIFLFLFISANYVFADSNEILITEFMAINSNILADEDGEHPDWIEIYNPGDNSINLNGWSLTDKEDELKKWEFPAISINSHSYMVIFASDKDKKDPTKNLHTNFKLSGSGEFLAICEPDGTISHSYSPSFPAQRQDVSYGLYQGQEVFFSSPTPGAENTFGNLPFPPNFSMTRGFYETPIDVSLSAPGNSGSIYYTLDGTRPTKTTGTVYSGPIHITKTTPLSVASINSSNVSSEIITHTYWFLEDILKQSNSPEGYPSDWKMASSSTSIPADYEMDQEVCEAPEYKSQMEEAMTSIPSMNIVTTKDYLFNDQNDANNGGIYIYTGKPNGTGLSWVRPTSVEYYDPQNGQEFQINCRLKLHGGNSRNPGNSPKHGFELTFSSTYGPSKLNFNLFDEKGATNEFNNLVLRGGYNYSWIKNNPTQRADAQGLQDPWAKQTQLDMGKTSGHEKFVHLYINGLYWGLYNLAEKYTNDFFESYMKGQEEDFDIVKEKQVVSSGNINAFNALISQMNNNLSNNANYQKIQGKNPDGSVNTSYANLLDLDNYIDYMLINYYVGNGDWNKNNWVMVRNRVTNEAGFRFVCWDVETAMTDLQTNLVSEDGDDRNPMSFIKYLTRNNDFKVMLSDRIQKHMITKGGALTPEEAIKRYQALADEIDMPIIAESARWGDYRKDVAPSDDVRKLYTRNGDWIPRKEGLINNYFPNRTDILIQQLKNKGYFPNLAAPVYTHDSGTLASGFNLGISSNEGTIYYTLDGSDPREEITSNVSSLAQLYNGLIAINEDVTVKARTKSGSQWSPMAVAKFKIGFPTASPVIEKQTDLFAGNYPNPFKESTKIFFTLPNEGNVQVDIIGIDGRIISHVYDGFMPSGYNTVNWSPSSNKSGLFLYKIKFDDKYFFGKILRH